MSGIPAWAVRGAKVVCISTHPEWASLPVETPRVGETYTLRAVDVNPFDGVACCWLEEIADQFCLDPRAIGFVAFGLFRFRPLVDDEAQERDVALFSHHLRQNAPELVE